MINKKTTFEQVPLKIVKEIVETETEPETQIELGQATKKNASPRVIVSTVGHRSRGKR
jgi:hypothetical protein